MSPLVWKTEKRKVTDLVPNSQNPRSMSPEQVENLKKSLKKFNLVEIPVIDQDNKVIAGHQRLMVLKLLGRVQEQIEVRVPNRKLTKKEYDQYLLTSNRVHGDWNWDLLKDFDIDLLLDVGFDDMDLSHVWDDSLETEDDNFDVEKELAKIKKPITKTGDVYQLGIHRLICGDSTKLDDVKKVVGEVAIDMIYSDPIYNIGLDYSKGVSTAGKYGGKTNDKKTSVDYRAFLKSTMENGLMVAKPDVHVFYWCDENYIGLVQSLYGELGIVNRRVCLWVKNNFNMTPGIAFNKAYEPNVYGTRGKPYLAPKIQNLNELMNKEIGNGNRVADDIMDLFSIWLAKRLPGQEYEHPTQKPPTLHEKALRRCTKIGDAILDLFGGSGSTLIACEQLKRRAFLVEIEPIFCDLIIRRYEALTKTKAKLIS
jgi:DNA modification methylase